MSELAKTLASEFEDKVYAHAYMEDFSVSRLAGQIHALRKNRNWTQAELAEKSGMTQARVSKYESGDFESVTLSTLNKFSKAFDVHAQLCFVPFSDAILDVVNLSPKKLVVRERKESINLMMSLEELANIDNIWKSVPPNRFIGTGKKQPQSVSVNLGGLDRKCGNT